MKVLATLVFGMLVASCGGGGGGGGGADVAGATGPAANVSSPSALAAADVLALYPHFYMSMVGQDSMLMLALGFSNPLFGANPQQDCQTGQATASGPATAPLVTYLACAQAQNTQDFNVPGVPVFVSSTKRDGSIAYQLLSKGGDFDTTRQNFDADYSAMFTGLRMATEVSMAGRATVSSSNTLAGNIRWTYTASDGLTRGTVLFRSPSFNWSAVIAGTSFNSAVTNASTLWTLEAGGWIREANLTLQQNEGPFAGKDIILRNVRPAEILSATPDAIISTGTQDIGAFAQASSGVDELQYGNSHVYVTYSSTGLTLDLDLNGDGCLESGAVVTRAELQAAIAGDTPIPASLLQPHTGCVTPPAAN
jgi:hypothetical protein